VTDDHQVGQAASVVRRAQRIGHVRGRSRSRDADPLRQERHQQLATRQRVVIGNVNAEHCRVEIAEVTGERRRRLVDREGEREHRPAGGPRLERQPAVHQLNELLRDRQTQSRAGFPRRASGGQPRERGEQPRPCGARHTGAAVGNDHCERASAASRPAPFRADLDGDGAGIGELDGVGDEVREHLPDAARIADEQRAADTRRIDPQVESLRPGGRTELPHDVLHERNHVEFLRLELYGARVEPREVEHVVDDIEQ
jgi:hypothetical protein